MPDGDRAIAETLRAIIRAHAPDLAPRTWYGVPAYTQDGKVLVFFKAAAKSKVRYAEVDTTSGRTSTTQTFGAPCTPSPR
jgi:uncharacterized protein YdhG (YjbR/CyaY superfamily)